MGERIESMSARDNISEQEKGMYGDYRLCAYLFSSHQAAESQVTRAVPSQKAPILSDLIVKFPGRCWTLQARASLVPAVAMGLISLFLAGFEALVCGGRLAIYCSSRVDRGDSVAMKEITAPQAEHV